MHHAEAQQMRSKSQTMANFMAIANKYAIVDSAMQKLIRLLQADNVPADEPTRRHLTEAKGSSKWNDSDHDRNGKRKDEQPNDCYGSKHVIDIEAFHSTAGGSR
jgi:hypothetical protein